MDKLVTIGIVILVLFYLLVATPADVGCNSTSDAVVAQLWAATCDGQVAAGGGR